MEELHANAGFGDGNFGDRTALAQGRRWMIGGDRNDTQSRHITRDLG